MWVTTVYGLLTLVGVGVCACASVYVCYLHAHEDVCFKRVARHRHCFKKVFASGHLCSVLFNLRAVAVPTIACILLPFTSLPPPSSFREFYENYPARSTVS